MACISRQQVVTGWLGFGTLSGVTRAIAKLLFALFVILFLLALLAVLGLIHLAQGGPDPFNPGVSR
jgi:uncharacterized membrane protein YtjA (UPF0391 family)